MKTSNAFEVVSASAGSGKTYRLVSRYLACCLKTGLNGFKPEAFRHILALTFTNKAAGEMKERILLYLKEIGEGTAGASLVEDLTKALGISEGELQVRARVARATMLHRYTELSVMTLDSFTNRLVRSFARDLALDQDYRIELDQDRIIEAAVDSMLDRVGDPKHKAFTQMLRGFARLQVEEEKDSRIRHPLLGHGKEVLKEGMREILEAMRDLTPEDFMAASKAIRAEVNRWLWLSASLHRAPFWHVLIVALCEATPVSIDSAPNASIICRPSAQCSPFANWATAALQPCASQLALVAPDVS